MGRSKHRARATRSSAASASGEDTSVARVDAALAAGRFKDAVAAGKALLKGASGADEATARERLARAYAGRAGQLADKDMFVEALAILEQRESACGAPPPAAEQLSWTLRAGRPERAAALLAEHAPALERSGELPALRERLAARVLGGDEALLGWLDPDEPLRRDHPAAEALLQAFCADDDAAFGVAAKRLPWRSPYRGFRQLLEAWRRHAGAPDAAAAALERIAPDSPFGALAKRLQRLLEPADEALPEAVRRLRALEPDELDAAAAMGGWSPSVVALLRAARALGDAPDAKSRLRLLLGHADAFAADEARGAAHALLLQAPRAMREVVARIGKLSAFDTARLAALRAERGGEEPFDVDEAWRDVLDALEDAGGGEADGHATGVPSGADRPLALALVHRRLAALWSRPPLALQPGDVALDELERSLRLDPDDVPTAVRVIAMYRDEGDLKSAREVLDGTLERFPEDSRVLLEAVRTALAGGAFKKASRLAERLLAIDPVNVPVKALLLDAALAHARKQIRSGRLDLARRQLDDTAARAGPGEPRARVEILYALLELAGGGREAEASGRRRLRAGFEALGGELAALFAVALESVQLGRDPKATLARAKLPAARGFGTKEAVLGLVRALGALREDEALVHEALAPLEATLVAAAKKRWSRAEYESLCETLLRCDLLHVLEPYAERASRRHTQVPAFVYLHEYAAVRGNFFALDEAAIGRLHSAVRHAHRIDDVRTAQRIEEFLSPPLFGGFDAFGDFDGFDRFGDAEEEDRFVDPFGGRGGGRSGGEGGGSAPGDLVPPDDLPPAFRELLDLVGMEGILEIERAAERGEDTDTVVARLLDRIDPARLAGGPAGGLLPGGRERDREPERRSGRGRARGRRR